MTASLDERLYRRSPGQLEFDVGVVSDREWWRHDGAIVAAMGEGGGNTIHAGRVNWLGGCYSMGPLCLAYRKADGTELARYARGGYPMLVRNLGIPFDEYRIGLRKPLGRVLCRYCVSVCTDGV